jgi:predicted dehydrogenase
MIRIAVVGLGYWGPNLARNFSACPGTKLHSICDRDKSRLAALGLTYPAAKACEDLGEVLSNPEVDAVAIATPVRTHSELAEAALRAGKHVLIEKPMTHSVETAEKLVALAKEKGLVCMVDHVFIYSPAVRKMKEILDSGAIGELFFIDSVRINLGLFQHDVNVLWDLAPHDLSIVDFLVGRVPRSVSAFGSVHASKSIEDVAYLNLDFGNGLIANFHVNWLSPVKVRHFLVGASRKSILYNDLDASEPLKIYDRGVVVNGDLEARRNVLVDYRSGDVLSPHIGKEEPLRVMVEHFADCIEHGKKPLSSAEEGLRVVRILEAAQQSIKAQGGRITL